MIGATGSPQLDRYLQQWRFYKRLFLIFAVINAFSLSASVVLGVRYFGFKKAELSQQSKLLDQTAQADRALDILNSLRRELAPGGGKHLGLHSREDEVHVLGLLDRWQTFKTLAAGLSVTLPDSMRLLGEDNNTSSAFELLDARLSEVKTQNYAQMKTNLQVFAGVQKELVMTGLLTLVFGFLFPTLIMWMLAKAMGSLRREMHSAVIEFLRGWRQAENAYGPGAFKSPEFWLQILLMSGQFAGQMSSHPAAQIASELAFIVRQELQRAAASAA